MMMVLGLYFTNDHRSHQLGLHETVEYAKAIVPQGGRFRQNHLVAKAADKVHNWMPYLCRPSLNGVFKHVLHFPYRKISPADAFSPVPIITHTHTKAYESLDC